MAAGLRTGSAGVSRIIRIPSSGGEGMTSIDIRRGGAPFLSILSTASLLLVSAWSVAGYEKPISNFSSATADAEKVLISLNKEPGFPIWIQATGPKAAGTLAKSRDP